MSPKIPITTVGDIDEEISSYLLKRDGSIGKAVRNGVETHVKFPQSTRVSTEWALFVPPEYDLATACDSGAWCCTTKGVAQLEVLGMLFGALTDTRLCFITPMKVIMEDIQEQTGLSVRLPDMSDWPFDEEESE
jgi:hypothetical protein